MTNTTINSPAGMRHSRIASAGCVVQLVGPPGCGKTSLIEATARRLVNRAKLGAIVAHRAAARDAASLQHAGAWALALDKPDSVDALADAIEQAPHRLDLLFIESPQTDPIPGATRVAIFSVSGGDSKAAELSAELDNADLVLLTKCDLLPHVKFDLDLFRDDVTRVKRNARIIQISSADGTGLTQWTDWLLARVIQSHTTHDPGVTPEMAEWWFG